MKAKWVALGVTALCAVYLVVAGLRAWALLTSGQWEGVLLGVGVLLVRRARSAMRHAADLRRAG